MGEYVNPAKIFGENVFNDTVMQERLPKNVYKKLKKIIEEGGELDLATADTIAHEMKERAIEKGATHYTHWFQPLTGTTAEKHDSFITAPMPNGKVLMSFSGKELIKVADMLRRRKIWSRHADLHAGRLSPCRIRKRHGQTDADGRVYRTAPRRQGCQML